MPVTAFVTDGNERPALAITRSLGRRGIAVVVGEELPRSLAGSSRYCRRQVTYPSPSRNPGAFAEFLTAFVRSEHIDVVLPVTDVATRAVASGRDALSPCRSAVPPIEAFEAVTDKRELTGRAARCGIAVPRTHVVHGASQLAAVLDDVGYPAVVKPSHSRVPIGGGWLATTVHYADDRRELRRLYHDVPYLREGTSLVQERVAGTGLGLFALCDRGRILTTFAHRRLREKPPSGGVSVLCESIPVDPKLRADAERLLGPLGWHGVAMLEYKEDRRTGRRVLIEINGRFWGSLQLAVDAGVDFPFLAWQLASGRTPEPPRAYRVGVRSRWFLGDVDHLLWRVRHDRHGLPATAPSRLGALGAFLAGTAPGVRGEILRWADVGPAAYEFREYMTSGFQSLWARRHRPSAAVSHAADAARALQGGAHVDIGDSGPARNAPLDDRAAICATAESVASDVH